MDLENVWYIQIQNGEPHEYPIPHWNLVTIYPNLDPSNPPEGFARCVRNEYPLLRQNETVEQVSFQLSNFYTSELNTQTWEEVFHIRQKTKEEKKEILKELLKLGAPSEHHSLDKQKLEWVLPKNMPELPEPEEVKGNIKIQVRKNDPGPKLPEPKIPHPKDGKKYNWVSDKWVLIDVTGNTFDDWIFNSNTYIWQPAIKCEYPNPENYDWDPKNKKWISKEENKSNRILNENDTEEHIWDDTKKQWYNKPKGNKNI